MEGPYKDCVFRADLLTNTVAIGNSCFWLVNFWKKSSPLEPLIQMNRNLVGSIYGSPLWRLFISFWSFNKHGNI